MYVAVFVCSLPQLVCVCVRKSVPNWIRAFARSRVIGFDYHFFWHLYERARALAHVKQKNGVISLFYVRTQSADTNFVGSKDKQTFVFLFCLWYIVYILLSFHSWRCQCCPPPPTICFSFSGRKCTVCQCSRHHLYSQFSLLLLLFLGIILANCSRFQYTHNFFSFFWWAIVSNVRLFA